ncbi:hypothetical protein SERLA73DRAFT_17691, partial [Serpula lacrymans var. lacrymans S7.3]
DGTLNKNGAINEFVILLMEIDGHVEKIHLAVTNLGNGKMFLGHEWLNKHNPKIDWKELKLTF